jgi:hypothetical protein
MYKTSFTITQMPVGNYQMEFFMLISRYKRTGRLGGLVRNKTI